MPALARPTLCGPPDAPLADIATFMAGFSIESSATGCDEVAALQGTLSKGVRVYLPCLPGRPLWSMAEPAKRLRAAGFEPVPHLAARSIASAELLEGLLMGLSGANVRRVLAVGGDRGRPAGPYASAVELIESGLLQRYGIREIGIAGYPQGHPRIAPLMLERAFAAKIEAAQQTGLAVHIVTQFCFDGAAVCGWIERLRERGIEQPVRVGLAGPADLTTLVRYSRRCGVRASLQGLTRHTGLVKHLVGISTPDGMVRPLAEAAATGRLGRIAPHFFSFGGAGQTARWAATALAGGVALDRTGGFRIVPPENRR